ncbi:MAG: MoaD/ThiS family protein [Chloroflexi bacterium]|nr:MoaD/ThiS family protein [Chloroflexota bacterium]
MPVAIAPPFTAGMVAIHIPALKGGATTMMGPSGGDLNQLDTSPPLAHDSFNHLFQAGTAVGNAKIEVFPWLTELFGASRASHMTMDVAIADGQTVRQLLARLAQQYPDFGQRGFSLETGLPSSLVSLFLNERFLELAGGLDAPLGDGDNIMMIPAWEGGSGLRAVGRTPCAPTGFGSHPPGGPRLADNMAAP